MIGAGLSFYGPGEPDQEDVVKHTGIWYKMQEQQAYCFALEYYGYYPFGSFII